MGKLHGMRALVGFWVDGDARRKIHIDAHGLHAATFDWLAPVMPVYQAVNQDKFFFDHPREWKKLQDLGVQDMLPRRKADDRPAYHYDIRHAMTTSVVISSICPKLADLIPGGPKYKHKVYNKVYPVQDYIRQCQEEWDRFQQDWAAAGDTHNHVPYPYSDTDVKGWLAELKNSASDLVADDSAALAIAGPAGKPEENEQSYNESLFDWWTNSGSKD